jgi:hypothetical protein
LHSIEELINMKLKEHVIDGKLNRWNVKSFSKMPKYQMSYRKHSGCCDRDFLLFLLDSSGKYWETTTFCQDCFLLHLFQLIIH